MNFSFSINFRRLAVASAALVAISAAPAYSQTIRMDALFSVLPGSPHAPFGLSVSPAPAGPMWIKWREFETGLTQSVDAVARCRAEPLTCSRAETRLIALIDMARNADGRAKFGLVNRKINLSIAYTSDAEQHGSADVWSSALDSLASGQGDCEDFAITKYVTLREAGVAASDLRLLVGRVHNSQGSAHAVLAARLDGHWLILDNRRMALLEDTAADMQPIFAFDDKGVTQFGGPAPAIMVAQQETAQDTKRADVTSADMRPASGADTLAFAETLPLLM
ncbi:MAG: transglutaminase-like cysteine peptidase [Xanthobacteraceae bacterium]